MAITSIDPMTALVVIDLQKGITGRDAAHPIAQVLGANTRLVEAFRGRNLPIVRVRVTFASDRSDALKPRADFTPNFGPMPADWDELDPRVPIAPTDIVVVKRQWGAFYGTDLELQLRRRGVTGIVLTGIATTYGVESTARDAYERGFQLTFATDAMTDMNLEAHERALKYVFGRIGECGTADEVIAALGA